MISTVVIPCVNHHAGLASRVAHQADEAGLPSLLVMQGNGFLPPHPQGLPSTTEVMPVDRPVGKGGAVQLAIRRLLYRTPVVVHDADLVLDIGDLSAFAKYAAAGQWVRPLYPAGEGRLSRKVPDLLDVLGVKVNHRLLTGSGMLSGIAGYPVSALQTLATCTAGYGFDLEVALRLLETDEHSLEVHPMTTAREHEPGDEAHLVRMLEENMMVIGRWATW